jgi:site-specific DNA recombinase
MNYMQLDNFAKGHSKEVDRSGIPNAVIYTRVSTKEQADTNQSLETQKKYCVEYAAKHNLNVAGFFGGTYESAKTDERNEFNRMIRFVKNHKEKVTSILVYSLDRFSRTGDNAIYISGQLKKQGISIIAVTQPIDVSTVSGILHQNIQFIFSKYDNDLRREKCVAGMKEKLLRGEWLGVPPLGYSLAAGGRKKEQVIVINENGKFIKQAFLWKLNESLPNIDIANRLKKIGFNICRKRLTETLKNPFYCGFISHNMLEGKLVKGKHEPIISQEIFLTVNNDMKKNPHGYVWNKRNEDLPLKHFMRCECGRPITGYVVKPKGIYYYKCNKIGCNCNKSAIQLHEKFKDLLGQFHIDKRFIPAIKDQLQNTYYYFVKADQETHKSMKIRLADFQLKFDKLEQRFALGEIDKNVYENVGSKMKEEMKTIETELQKTAKSLSNPLNDLGDVLELASDLKSLWVKGNLEHKKALQKVAFPRGIFYNKVLDSYRTEKVNLVLDLSRKISEDCKMGKKGKVGISPDFSPPVAGARLELTTFGL